MPLNQDVNIFVAAKKRCAPNLPLREELITVGIECIYAPEGSLEYFLKQAKGKENIVKNRWTEQLKRKRMDVEVDYKVLGYGTPEENEVGSRSLTPESNHIGTRLSAINSSIDDDGDDATLVSTEYEMEDMTVHTYALIGCEKSSIAPQDSKDMPPNAIIAYDHDDGSFLMQEFDGFHSIEVIERESKYESNKILGESDESKFGSIIDKEVSVSFTDEDLSTYADSTCDPLGSDSYLHINAAITKINGNHHDMEVSPSSVSKWRDSFFSALEDVYIEMKDVEELLSKQDGSLKFAREVDSRTPLHCICDCELPCRPFDETSLQNFSKVRDFILKSRTILTDRLILIKKIMYLNINACYQTDSFGDLPVHLLARRLLAWSSHTPTLIKTCTILHRRKLFDLFDTMGQFIDLVLRPIAAKRDRKTLSLPGSTGVMLPLHICLLFGVKLDIFNDILVGYDDGASIPYIYYHGLQPHEILPITLMEDARIVNYLFQTHLQHDTQISSKEIKWPTTLSTTHTAQALLWRCDLLFAFHPISPYRKEKARMSRIETLVKKEIKLKIGQQAQDHSLAVRNIWIWMCCFQNQQDESDNYNENVEHIVEDLKSAHLKILLELKSEHGNALFNDATPNVKDIFLRKLEVEAQSIERSS